MVTVHLAEALRQSGQIEQASSLLESVADALIESLGENAAGSVNALLVRARIQCSHSGLRCRSAAQRAKTAAEATHGAEHERSLEAARLLQGAGLKRSRQKPAGATS
jgi:hypothetical protein